MVVMGSVRLLDSLANLIYIDLLTTQYLVSVPIESILGSRDEHMQT